jgi:hypothetical protein
MLEIEKEGYHMAAKHPELPSAKEIKQEWVNGLILAIDSGLEIYDRMLIPDAILRAFGCEAIWGFSSIDQNNMTAVAFSAMTKELSYLVERYAAINDDKKELLLVAFRRNAEDVIKLARKFKISPYPNNYLIVENIAQLAFDLD